MSLAIRIQELRKKSGDSQEQLAGKLGVSRQAISKWESEQGIPDLNNIIKISECYDVSLDFLVKGISNDTESKQSNQDVMKEPVPEKKKPKLDKGLKKVLLVLLAFLGISLCGVVFLSLLTFATQFIANI